MKYCLLPVGHRKGYDETTFCKMCNVTHKLLAIGKDVMRLTLQGMHVTHLLLVIGKNVMRLLLEGVH